MIRNALIALYILAVLAISAVSRADIQYIPVDQIVKPKRPIGPTLEQTVDPLPGLGNVGDGGVKMLSIGNSEVSK